MRRLIPLLVVAFAAAACASAETGDAEVELNTALGRRGTPSSTTMPPIPTNTPSTTPATQAPVLTSGPQTTTSAAPTTTEVPCAALETAAVVASGDFWRLEGRADDGTPVRSPDYPLAEALGQLTSERDFDLDGHPEYVVTLMAPDVARLMVLEFRDCSLVEPRDAFSGEPLRPLVGAYPDTLGRVTCLADGLEIAALRATFDPPGDARSGHVRAGHERTHTLVERLGGDGRRGQPVCRLVGGAVVDRTRARARRSRGVDPARLLIASVGDGRVRAGTGHVAARWAAARVASHGVGHRQAELFAERCQPGQDVAELVQLLVLGALPDGLRQLTQLLGQPGDRGRDTALGVAKAVGVGHQLLELVEVHGGGLYGRC